MNVSFTPTLTDRELRWLRHIAIHGPQSSEFLLELCADTHSCRDTGKRTLKKLRDLEYLRLPQQQRHTAKADFNPHVYDLTKQAERCLRSLGDLETVRPTGHWWHAFLTASITSAIAIECNRRGYQYIPAHDILNRHGATLAVPHGQQKLIPDQLFAINYGGSFRSFVLEVDRGTEPYASESARKSLRRMIESYAELSAKDALRRHYGLKSPLLVIFAFTAPERADHCVRLLKPLPTRFTAIALVGVVPSGFVRFAPLHKAVANRWTRAQHMPINLFAEC